MRTGEVEAVRDAHDFDAVRAELVERRQRVRDAGAREPVEPEHEQTSAVQSSRARVNEQALELLARHCLRAALLGAPIVDRVAACGGEALDGAFLGGVILGARTNADVGEGGHGRCPSTRRMRDARTAPSGTTNLDLAPDQRLRERRARVLALQPRGRRNVAENGRVNVPRMQVNLLPREHLAVVGHRPAGSRGRLLTGRSGAPGVARTRRPRR